MKKIKIAMIGVGGMGMNHCRSIQKIERFELAAVCDLDLKKRDAAAAEFGCEAYCDHETLFAEAACDAVVIATPHYSHTQIGIDALNAGLHVLVDKPVSVHKADCERLIRAHENKRQVFAAMFNQRTDPCYRKIKQLISEGELGRLMRVNWIITDWFRPQRYYDSGGWRATWAGEGGGVLINQCPHQLDLLQWFCGMPIRVSAHCGIGKHHEIEVEDEVSAYFEYANGATGVFVTSTGEAPGTNRLELTGTRGKIIAEGGKLLFTRNEISCDEFSITTDQAFAKPEVWNMEIPFSSTGGQHEQVLRNFGDAIRHKAKLIAPAAEGMASVELANAMLLSSIKGRPVDIPLNAAVFHRELNRLVRGSKEKKAVRKADLSGFAQSF
jgi:predicted dehydrogenase